MAFDKSESDNLLVQTGRRCCICQRLHGVQLHHIVPVEKGGSDSIDNAVPLCPNCHNEVHSGHASGRVTRCYTAGELKQHRQRTIQQAHNAAHWQPTSPAAQQDQELIMCDCQCNSLMQLSHPVELDARSHVSLDVCKLHCNLSLKFCQQQLFKIAALMLTPQCPAKF